MSDDNPSIPLTNTNTRGGRGRGGRGSRGRGRGRGRGGKPVNKANSIDKSALSTGDDSEESGEKTRLDEVTIKVDQVKEVLKDNLKTAIDRGNKMDEIEGKSEILLKDSETFKESSNKLKNMFCRRHWKNLILIALLVIIVLIIIIVSSMKSSSST